MRLIVNISVRFMLILMQMVVRVRKACQAPPLVFLEV